VGSAEATRAASADRFTPIVEGILAAWGVADLVCLGEAHGSKNDSDLRLALVRHPKFPRLVNVIVVEGVNPFHQGLLDRFILDGAAMSRDELAIVWRDSTAVEVWESPIYEAFLRAVREVNLGLPRENRVRVIGGDTPIDWRSITRAEQLVPLMNRGAVIRKIIAEQVLEKKLKGLAIYGSGHCEKRGMGFPGELADRYPGRLWSVYAGDAAKTKQAFKLGDKPAYLVVTGTKRQAMPTSGIFPWTFHEKLTMGDMLDAIVYYGDVEDVVVRADTTELKTKYGAELERRGRLTMEAASLIRLRRSR
jgi:hypothetical protein